MKPENIPLPWKPFYYISFFQYAYQLLMVNDLEQRVFEPCDADDLFTPNCSLGFCNTGKTLVAGSFLTIVCPTNY